MPKPIIDLSIFTELQVTAGADFVAERAAGFVLQAPRLIGELRDAIHAHSESRFRHAAHALKTQAQTFGAMSLGAQARALELGTLPQSPQALAAVDRACAEAAQELLTLVRH